MKFTTAQDLVDALIITLSMLQETAEHPERFTVAEVQGISRFARTLVNYGIKHTATVGRTPEDANVANR
jgi:hypothetical protein